jgi:hypothetical protein
MRPDIGQAVGRHGKQALPGEFRFDCRQSRQTSFEVVAQFAYRRTLGRTLKALQRFSNRRLQPLGHLTVRSYVYVR